MDEPTEYREPTREVRQWAMFCHFSAFLGLVFPFGNLLGPLIVWQIKKDLDPFVVARGWDPAAAWLPRAVKAMQERSVTLVQMADGLAPFYAAEVAFDPRAKAKFLTPDALPVLAGLADVVAKAEPFEAGPIGAAAEAWLASKGLELKKVGQPIRVALTGATVSPPLWDTMEVLGRERALARLRAAAAG